MPSIRKTKKRLKREIAELIDDFCKCDIKTISGLYLANAIDSHIIQLTQELQQLKRKKR